MLNKYIIFDVDYHYISNDVYCPLRSSGQWGTCLETPHVGKLANVCCKYKTPDSGSHFILRCLFYSLSKYLLVTLIGQMFS